jgi:hypothetical protein
MRRGVVERPVAVLTWAKVRCGEDEDPRPATKSRIDSLVSVSAVSATGAKKECGMKGCCSCGKEFALSSFDRWQNQVTRLHKTSCEIFTCLLKNKPKPATYKTF